MARGARGFAADERLEHIFFDAGGDARPAVFDRDGHHRRRQSNAHAGFSAITDRVVDQIGQRAVQLVGIGQS